MQNSKETKIWNATLYLRLSRDDGDKEESNSITGQRELLREFHPNPPGASGIRRQDRRRLHRFQFRASELQEDAGGRKGGAY